MNIQKIYNFKSENIKINSVIVDNKCATNMRNVWAIGDVADSGEMLAHVASTQGEMVAEIIAGQKPHIDYNLSLIHI